MAFFRGTTQSSDFRYGDKTKAQIAALKAAAPKEYDAKIDMGRVCKPIIDGWIARRVAEILGFEDEVVTGLAVNYLATTNVRGTCCAVLAAQHL